MYVQYVCVCTLTPYAKGYDKLCDQIENDNIYNMNKTKYKKS